MEQLKLSSNTAKLHQMFGKRLYADKYSFVSEICQNAVDSHRMSGQDKPVEVGIYDRAVSSSFRTYYTFYVKDVGLSFEDKEDFIKKVCTILESGKSENKTNDENCAMGMHGIGSISVSAFNSEWKYTVVTPSKRKFTAILKEVDGIGLTYDLSEYEDTDEEKSVLFEVEIPNHVTINQFVNCVTSKLSYFKDILFKFTSRVIEDVPKLLTLNTEFKIFESEDFQYSTLNKNTDMHISIDQYAYQIRWDVLGINPIQNFPVALKFGLGDGLTPDITRENLILNEEYKTIILGKINKVSEWFIVKYNKTIPDAGFDSLREYNRAINGGRSFRISDISETISFNLEDVKKYSTIKPKSIKLKDVDDDILKNFMTSLNGGKDMFSLIYEISNKGSLVKREDSRWRAYSYSTNILMDVSLDKKRSAFLKTVHTGSGLYSVRKYLNRRYLENFYKIPTKAYALDIYKTTGENIYRYYYKQYKLLHDYFVKDNFIKLSDIQIPKDQKPTVKKISVSVRKQKFDPNTLSGQITLRFAENLSKQSHNFCCKFTDKIYDIKDVFKIREFVIYGRSEDRNSLDRLHKMINYLSPWSNRHTPKSNIRICMVNETDFKVLQKLNLHNFMEVTDFTQGKHKFFGQVMTAFLIQRDVIKRYNRIIDKRRSIRDHISEDLYNKIEKLLAYTKRYRPDAYLDDYSHKDDQFTKDLLSIFHEKKLRDETIWVDAKYVLDNIHKVETVQYFPEQMIDSKQIAIIQDIAKYRKLKLDLKHYKQADNEQQNASVGD